jgi:hypothetical protein
MPKQIDVSDIEVIEMKSSSDGVMFATIFVKYVDRGCITIHFPLPAGVIDIVMAGNVYFDVGERDFFRTGIAGVSGGVSGGISGAGDMMSVDDMVASTDALI